MKKKQEILTLHGQTIHPLGEHCDFCDRVKKEFDDNFKAEEYVISQPHLLDYDEVY